MAKIPKKIEQSTVKPTVEKLPKEGNIEKDPIPSRISSREEKEEENDEEVDYLRKFQYKKVNNIPVWTFPNSDPLTDPDKGSKAEKMKEFLLSEPKVYMMIPAESGSSPKVPKSITRNGYRLDFPVNTYIYVPREIAKDFVSESKQTLEALSRNTVDSNPKPGADQALN
jgi:hypothetical protein